MKNKLTQQINYEEFMNQYKDYYEDYMKEYEEFESFYEYGPLSEKYWTYEPKILVCNLEPYDRREEFVPVNLDLYKEWIKARTGKFTAKFISGLIKNIKPAKPSESINFKVFTDNEMLTDIGNIAYMNFRISSGSNIPADEAGILKDVRTHPDYIRKQIELLTPDIIIIGGKIGCIAYNELFHLSLKFDSTTVLDNRVICSMRHFRSANYKYYNEKVNEIIQLYMSINRAK